MKRTPLKKLGKKGLEWARVRAELKPRFEAAGITSCEIKLPACWGSLNVWFCHADRRGKGDLYEVVLGCAPCSKAFNDLNSREEARRIRAIIAKREIQP